MNIFLAIILGGFFGFSLYMVGATTNAKILKMLRLEDLTLAKIILFAIGFSSVLLSVTGILGIFDVSHLSIKSMNLGVILGGLIFGVGFGMAGTCPGTCVGAVGGVKGLKKAIVAVVGGLFGAFTFTIFYEKLNNMKLFTTLDFGRLTLFSLSEKYPSVFNIGFIGLLVLGIIFMIGAYILPSKILSK